MGRNQASKDHDKYEAFDIYEDNEADSNKLSKTYKGFVKRKRLFLIVGLLLLFLCVVIAAQSGPIDIPFLDVAKYIITFDVNGAGGVIWNIRMVRIVGALLAGAGLAVAGVVMQCIPPPLKMLRKIWISNITLPVSVF